MSVVTEILVYCDGCGENAGGDDRGWTAKLIRKIRKENGWIQRGRKDYCPNCAQSRNRSRVAMAAKEGSDDGA